MGRTLASLLLLSCCASAQEWPKWAQELPEKAVEAKVGDKVWATVPSGVAEMVEVAVFTVSAVDGNTATLSNQLRKKYGKVPGALIHPLLDRSKVQEGDVVHGYAWSLQSIVCRVTKLGKQASMKHWWFDKVENGKLDELEPLRTGVEPMAWVSYPGRDRTMKGFCVALDGDRAWILGGVAEVTVEETAKLGALPIGAKDLQAGDKVQAYKFPWGYRPGVVEAVVEPGLCYRIQIDEEARLSPEDGPEEYYFADVLPAP